MMEKNYLAWHFSQALPDFTKSRLKLLSYTISFFNRLYLLPTEDWKSPAKRQVLPIKFLLI